MKLVTILLLCNNLRAELFSNLFSNFSSNESSNRDTNTLNYKCDIHRNLDANKKLLVCRLKEVLKHSKIDDCTKLGILCSSLDETPGSKKNN